MEKDLLKISYETSEEFYGILGFNFGELDQDRISKSKTDSMLSKLSTENVILRDRLEEAIRIIRKFVPEIETIQWSKKELEARDFLNRL